MKDSKQLIIKQLMERSAKLYWTYVIQYNQAEVYQNTQKWLTIISLILSGLVTSASFLSVIKICGMSNETGNIIIFILGIASIVILAFMTKFDYSKRIEAHTESATAVRRLWMKYQSLITDIKAGRFEDYEAICYNRDILRDEEYDILKNAPVTMQKAYQKAEKKIHKKKHGEISEEELLMGNEGHNIE